jgi:ribonuclease HI
VKIFLYTDGSSLGNPGPGGYGIVLLSDKGHYKEMSEGYRKTTNNRMELLSVIVGLETIRHKDSDIVVVSDSKYVVDAINKGWLDSWRKKGLSKKKNPDLWMRFLEARKGLKLTFDWVKGHAGNKYNEKCDQLAVKAAKGKNLKIDYGFENQDSEGSGLF